MQDWKFLVKITLTVSMGLLSFNSANADGKESNLGKPVDDYTGKELCLKWKEKAKTAFPVICAMDQSAKVVQHTVETGSTRMFTIAVWGGRDEHRTEAIRVANRMYRDGKVIAIVFGPDKDTHLRPETAEQSVHLEPYAHGGMAWEKTEKIGTKNLHQISGIVEDRFNSAYDLNYPRTASEK